MKKTDLENRQFPRIAATLPIHISPEFLGETIDLSETGLRFILQNPLLLSKALAKIELSPNEGIETEFKVIWNKHLVQQGKFIYGACFVRLKERDIENLRDSIIHSELNTFIDGITDDVSKEAVRKFFLKDLRKYLGELSILTKNSNQVTAIDNDVSQILKKLSDNIISTGERLTESINSKAIVKKIKQSFRVLIGPWAYKSLIIKRGFDKPRGYPGDYKMLEIIYDKKPFSAGFGRYFDIYSLDSRYAEAVRERKNRSVDVLADVINKNSTQSIKILDLACGSCREIREMLSLQKINYKGDIHFSLVDYDEEAINFSRQSLDIFQQDNIKFHYFQENILKFSENRSHYEKVFGRQDIIYSIGLIDYFPDRILKKLILFCLDLLAPEGQLILTIKDKDRDPFAPLFSSWFCDWEFVPRNEEGMISLLRSLRAHLKIENELDKSGKIVFLKISKD